MTKPNEVTQEEAEEMEMDFAMIGRPERLDFELRERMERARRARKNSLAREMLLPLLLDKIKPVGLQELTFKADPTTEIENPAGAEKRCDAY